MENKQQVEVIFENVNKLEIEVNNMFNSLMSDKNYSAEEIEKIITTVGDYAKKGIELTADLKKPLDIVKPIIKKYFYLSFLIQIIGFILIFIIPILGIGIVAVNNVLVIKYIVDMIKGNGFIKKPKELTALAYKLRMISNTLQSCYNLAIGKIIKLDNLEQRSETLINYYCAEIINQYMDNNILLPIPQYLEYPLRGMLQKCLGSNEPDIKKLLELYKSKEIGLEYEDVMMLIRQHKENR